MTCYTFLTEKYAPMRLLHPTMDSTLPLKFLGVPTHVLVILFHLFIDFARAIQVTF